ncbi:MAG: hypothetical protein HMLKMBBP_03039 [Planctomycetes bacterium]|nr:hypothetical protein [Planctomycetota bacterium]
MSSREPQGAGGVRVESITVRFKVFGAVAVLAAGTLGGILGATWIASRAYSRRWDQASRGERTMNVTGSARVRVRSDMATWSISVQGRGKELTEAYAEIKTGVDAVQRFLAANDVKPGEITLSGVDTDTHFQRDKDGNSTPEVAAYTLTRNFTIQSADVDRIARISGTVTELLESGVRVGTSAPSFTCSKIASLKVDLAGEATADARRRADTIASQAGCRVGEVRTARLGVLQITPPESNETSGEGVYDTTTIEKDVRAVVSLTAVIEEAQ